MCNCVMPFVSNYQKIITKLFFSFRCVIQLYILWVQQSPNTLGLIWVQTNSDWNEPTDSLWSHLILSLFTGINFCYFDICCLSFSFYERISTFSFLLKKEIVSLLSIVKVLFEIANVMYRCLQNFKKKIKNF